MERQTRREVKFPPFIEKMIEEGVLRGFHDGELKGFHDGEVKGEVKGEIKTLRETIFRLAGRRQLLLTDEQAQRISTCEDRVLLNRWFDNVLDAQSSDEVFR